MNQTAEVEHDGEKRKEVDIWEAQNNYRLEFDS